MRLDAFPVLMSALGLAAAPCVAAATATGQTLPTSHDLPMRLAAEAAMEAASACEKSGYHVTVTVVDRGGLRKVVLKGDRATPHTLDSSFGKAYTAVTLGPIVDLEATSQIAERVAANPASRHLAKVPGILLLGGGLGIRTGNEFVGAIGVGGAPGGHLDEACARAGVDRIRNRLVP